MKLTEIIFKKLAGKKYLELKEATATFAGQAQRINQATELLLDTKTVFNHGMPCFASLAAEEEFWSQQMAVK